MKTTALDPGQFRVSPEEMAAMKEQLAEKPIPRKSKREIEFYQFPKTVMDALIRANYGPAWALAAAIYKTWYDDFKKRNPVLVTSAVVVGYRLSRNQKSRALKILEGTGQYIVDRFAHHNPLVTMKWIPIRELVSR
jgi:hypothetical protein